MIKHEVVSILDIWPENTSISHNTHLLLAEVLVNGRLQALPDLLAGHSLQVDLREDVIDDAGICSGLLVGHCRKTSATCTNGQTLGSWIPVLERTWGRHVGGAAGRINRRRGGCVCSAIDGGVGVAGRQGLRR